MRLAGRTATATLSLLVLLVPVLLHGDALRREGVEATVPARPAPPVAPVDRTDAWAVSASAANVRRDHSPAAAVVGVAQCGDLVDLVAEWSSPEGVRWREVLVRRTGVAGWVFWSLLTRTDLPGPADARWDDTSTGLTGFCR